MAIEIPDWSSKSSDQLSKEADGVFEKPQIEDLDPTLLELYTKIRESLAKINEHITKVASMQSEIDTEKAKDGITSAQASAITTNTAKKGISTAQATQLSNLNAGRASGLITNINKVTAQITESVNVNAKTGAATLDSTIILSNGDRYALSQAITKVNKK